MSVLRARLGREDGFTLVELAVTTLLLGIVMSAVLSVLVSTQRAERFQDDTALAMDQTRAALDRLRTEMRAARRVLSTSTDTRVDFWVDRDQDQVADASEVVTYEIAAAGSDTVLQRFTQAAPTPRVVARGLVPGSTSSYFAYDNGTPDNDTRVVDVVLTADGTVVSSAKPLTVTASVRLRNVS